MNAPKCGVVKRPSVLLIAEAANPDWVSVPLVGWNLANALRQVADVHLVTQVRNRSALVARGLIEGRDFTALDTEAIAAPLHKLAEVLRFGAGKGWTTVTAIQALSYPYFERQVWKRFGQDIADRKYDIVHRVTPLSPTAPSLLANRCRRAGVPFLLGPLNGGLPWPKSYRKEQMKEHEWLSLVRRMYLWNPAVRATYKAASAIIAGSKYTASELSKFNRPIIYIPENGIDIRRFARQTKTQSEQLRLIFVGRLVPYKGADLAIEACRHVLRTGVACLDIVGDGPQRSELEAQITHLDLRHAVKIHGWRTQAEVAQFLSRADMLVFPSFREFGGGVVLEAMACGVVPVVLNYGGPGELVTKESGFRVKMGFRHEIVAGISAVIDSIIRDRRPLPTMAVACQKHISSLFTWEQKAKQIAQVYDWLIEQQEALPSFPFDVVDQSLLMGKI